MDTNKLLNRLESYCRISYTHGMGGAASMLQVEPEEGVILMNFGAKGILRYGPENTELYMDGEQCFLYMPEDENEIDCVSWESSQRTDYIGLIALMKEDLREYFNVSKNILIGPLNNLHLDYRKIFDRHERTEDLYSELLLLLGDLRAYY